jgi:hypothetical protein
LHVEAGDEGFGNRRHIRQQRRAYVTCHGDSHERAGLDVLHERRLISHDKADLARDRVRDALRNAAIRNVRDADSEVAGQHRERQMRGAPVA